jgi:hypothetical protein
MATFNSNLMLNKVPARALYAGQEFTTTGIINIKAGTKLLAGDVLKFARLGQYVSLRKLEVAVSGELDDGTVALDGTIGWLQCLDAAGNPLALEASDGVTYTSPVSDPNGIIDAANSPFETGILQAQGPAVRVFTEDAASGNAFEAAAAALAATGLAGPVDIGFTITDSANGDAATDVAIRVTLTLLQREGPAGEFTVDDSYTYLYDVDGSNGGLVS